MAFVIKHIKKFTKNVNKGVAATVIVLIFIKILHTETILFSVFNILLQIILTQIFFFILTQVI